MSLLAYFANSLDRLLHYRDLNFTYFFLLRFSYLFIFIIILIHYHNRVCIRCTTLYTLWYLNLYLVSSFSPQSGMSLEMMCYKLPISMTILPTVTINYRLVMVLTRSWMNSSSPNLAYFLNYFLPLMLLAWFMAESAIFLIFHCFIAHSHHAYYICISLCDIHY